MAFTKLNDPASTANPAAFVDQARLDKVEFDVLSQGARREGVIAGCDVTAQASPNMTVAVAAGTVVVGSDTQVTVSSGNVTIGAADATLARKDLVVANSSGTKSVVAGVASLIPCLPNVPANSVALGEVYVPGAATQISSGLITDKRVLVYDFATKPLTTKSLVATSSTAADVGAIIRGSASQTADLLQVQDSATAVLVKVTAGGHLVAMRDSAFGSITAPFSATTVSIKSRATGDVPLHVQGFAGQTVDLTRWSQDNGTVTGKVTANGQLHFGEVHFGSFTPDLSAYVNIVATGDIRALAIRASASQTNNLTEWQANGGGVIAALKADGKLVVQGNTALTASLTVYAQNASTAGVIVRAAASPSASLQEWQDSTGAVLSRVDKSGWLGIGVVPLTKLHMYGGGISNGAGYLVLDMDNGTPGSPLFALSKFTTQGAAVSASDNPGIAIQGSASGRPEVSWYRGGRTYPQFALRMSTSADAGGELWVGQGTVAPVLLMELGWANPMVRISSSIASNVTFAVRGAPSQSGDLTQWQDSSAVVLSKIRSDGMAHYGPTTTQAGTYYANDGAWLWYYTTTGFEFAPAGVIKAQIRPGGQMGLGGVASTDRMLDISVTHPGTATTLYSIISTPTFPATTTSVGYAAYGRVRTAASAFTMANAFVFYAAPPTIGAASTVSNLHGLYAANQGATGVTNAYGLWIEAQSGAATNNVPLVITGLGTFQIDSSGRVSIGRTPMDTSVMLRVLGGNPHADTTSTSTTGFQSSVAFPAATTVQGTSVSIAARKDTAGTLSAMTNIIVSATAITAGAVTTVTGLDIRNMGHASATNSYGGVIAPQSLSATLNIGFAIGTSTQGALWLGNDQAGTTFAGGIVFGSTRDVNLYRGGNDLLQTDDSLSIAGGATRLLLQSKTAANTNILASSVTGEANNRFLVAADGTLSWGPGTAGVDTNLYRGAGAQLKTDHNLVVVQSATIGFDDNSRKLFFGSAQDTNLYRSAANVLSTDDTFNINTAPNSVAFRWTNAGVTRWQWSTSNTEAGSNAGSDMVLSRYSDAGTFISTPLLVDRASGEFRFKSLLMWDAAANEQTTVGAAGGASALPATPTKYLKVKDSAGTTLVIPAYAAA